MIDDLVTRGVTEPYRMFTSRAEYRLALRADNADQRLTPVGIAVGCVGRERAQAFERKSAALAAGRAALAGTRVSPQEAGRHGLKVNPDGLRRSLYQLLGQPEIGAGALVAAFPEVAAIPGEILDQLARDAHYAPYLERQADEVARLARDEAVELPERLDYAAMPGLSRELQAKLALVRPRTLGQAGRIEGMTPAALTLVLMKARQAEAGRRAS